MPLMNQSTDRRRSKYHAQREYDRVIALLDREPVVFRKPKFKIGQRVSYESTYYGELLSGVSVVSEVGRGYKFMYYLEAFGKRYTFQEYELMGIETKTIPQTTSERLTAFLWTNSDPVGMALFKQRFLAYFIAKITRRVVVDNYVAYIPAGLILRHCMLEQGAAKNIIPIPIIENTRARAA